MADQISAQRESQSMVTLAEFNEVFGTLSQVWATALEAGVRADLPCMEKARALLFPNAGGETP